MGPMTPNEPKRKAFIVDTNVLLHDPRCLWKFAENIVVIPIQVIDELDKAKEREGELGANAREISRQIECIGVRGCLSDGVPTDTGGLLFIDRNGNNFGELPAGMERSVDNQILIVALAWQKKQREAKEQRGKRKVAKTRYPEFTEVIIVTKDRNLRIKANALKIASQDYLSDKLIARIDQLYSGTTTFTLPANIYANTMHQKGCIQAALLADEIPIDQLNANQHCRFELKGQSGSAIDTIYKKARQCFSIIPKSFVNRENRPSDIIPKNTEQRIAYELLMDQGIALVTLNGGAGSGKTLMALLAGYEQVVGGIYDQLLVYRPGHETGGKPIGFLRGDISEKFAPFMLPIFDNMKLVLDTDNPIIPDKQPRKIKKLAALQQTGGKVDRVQGLIARGLLEINPINYIRGRSITKSFVIVDEAQNLTPLDVKTIITRSGAGTKVVITGDVYQIDNPYVDSISNGLSHTVERLKGSDIVAHVTLVKGERSPLSGLAAMQL